MASHLKPITVSTIDEDDLPSFSGPTGTYKWQFPVEVFDGRWHKITVKDDQVASAANSFRSQCQATYGKRSNVYRHDGAIYARRLDEDYKKGQARGRKPGTTPGTTNPAARNAQQEEAAV